jgi:protoporphyrinogen oxidase
MSRVVVLGAGLTGLSAAYHLAKAGVTATVVEQHDEPGGACRSTTRDGYHFDLTGHLLHLQREESRSLLVELGVADSLRPHRRRAGVALAGAITPYPIQINTYRLPAAIRRDCVLGFVEAARRGGDAQEERGSFAEWVLARFGEGFARHFFFPYNRKLYGIEPEALTTEWVGRYVPRPELADVIDGAFGLFAKPVGYNATFLYPAKGGIRRLADALAARGPALRLRARVCTLRLGARELELVSGERIGWDALVATAPLSHLAAMTEDLPDALRARAATLRAVGVVNLNVGVRGRAPRREHWLYVPEERYPFYRVGIPSNHGRVAPPGRHTLSVEVSVPCGVPAAADLVERCLDGLESLGLLRDRNEIEVIEMARLDPAYVTFDATRPEAVAALREHYREHDVLLAGRWAEWKYSTMEDALGDGARAARRLLQ